MSDWAKSAKEKSKIIWCFTSKLNLNCYTFNTM